LGSADDACMHGGMPTLRGQCNQAFIYSVLYAVISGGYCLWRGAVSWRGEVPLRQILPGGMYYQTPTVLKQTEYAIATGPRLYSPESTLPRYLGTDQKFTYQKHVG